ncbi:MAG TPA: AraC family transcriptional regulator [Pyrinomonadaceae bacterium]|jgi:AraC family transcriptional regulator
MVERDKSPSAFSFADGARVAEDTCTPGRKQERHAHRHTNISLVLAGSVEETVGGALERAYALSVVIKPGGTEHSNQYGAKGARIFSVLFEPEMAASMRDWEPGLGRWRWVHGGAAARWMLRLMRTHRRHQMSRGGELEDCVYEALASLPCGQTSGTAAAPPRWLELVRQELDDTFTDGPRVRDLAAHAGVHPVYLARRFRRHMGCSITDYRTLLRVRAAAELLASSGVPPAAAADQCGFADQSHLCRVFKGATGLTPLDYRRFTKDF